MTTQTLNVARRPSLHEDMSAFFARVEAMFPPDSPWYVDADYARLAKGTGEEFSVRSDWRHPEHKMKGSFSVSVREEGFMDDTAQASDRLLYKFPSEMVDAFNTCQAARTIIESFGAYQVDCYNDNADFEGFNDLVEANYKTHKDLNGRDSVWWLMPLNYWDAEKCRRSFGVSVKKLVARLDPHVYKAEVFEGGAWVQLDEELDTHLNRAQTVDLFTRARVKPTA